MKYGVYVLEPAYTLVSDSQGEYALPIGTRRVRLESIELEFIPAYQVYSFKGCLLKPETVLELWPGIDLDTPLESSHRIKAWQGYEDTCYPLVNNSEYPQDTEYTLGAEH